MVKIKEIEINVLTLHETKRVARERIMSLFSRISRATVPNRIKENHFALLGKQKHAN